MTMPLSGPPERPAPPASATAPGGNPFGLVEALVGFVAAEVFASIAVTAFGAASGHPHQLKTFGADLANLAGVWTGFFGAVVLASLIWHHRRGEALASVSERWRAVRADYGIALSPWPDVPLGILVGVGSQYLLVPAFEAPLLPFVPHLYERLGGPAHQLTSTTQGASLAVLGLFLCVGAPFVEECFFRGLLLRALVGRLGALGARLGPGVAVVLSALVFGLAHFEPLQFLGLFGFGVLLALLARRTGRLGAGMVAHLSFNAVTVIALALAR
ncbi:MAG: CPBP family intramembrane metalloprotease [Actinomycetota bacterium]|nr:CPBP family intramembrane metalloprotease [Actinomycetota bacterium]